VFHLNNTIAAIASPPGMGAVSLIRVSGHDALEVCAKAVSCKQGVSELPDRYAALGKVKDSLGNIVDEVLVTVFRDQRSFTGEPVVELGCHGGVLVTRRVLDRLLECGARSADPGEFSRRAFENGKLDLTQTEAIMDLISAQTDLAMRAAHEQLDGKLGDQSETLRNSIIEVVAHVEAYIDFPEEDIDPDTGAGIMQRIIHIQDGIDLMLSTAEQGRIIREGVRTVICGEPNVGKSSLLNALLGYDRAIVSDVAGTTRDTVEEVINLQGIPLRLIDTAGVRESDDDIEMQGVERSKKQIELSDLIIEVVDGSQAGSRLVSEDEIKGKHHLLVINKQDLGIHDQWSDETGVRLSCVQDEGMQALSEAIVNELSLSDAVQGSHLVAINARHQDCLKKAKLSLHKAYEGLEAELGSELVSMDLRDAMEFIGEIAGKIDTEEVFDEIFGTFCIGK